MFLLVPAHPGCPGQNPQSRKTVVCVCVWHFQHKLAYMCTRFTRQTDALKYPSDFMVVLYLSLWPLVPKISTKDVTSFLSDDG